MAVPSVAICDERVALLFSERRQGRSRVLGMVVFLGRCGLRPPLVRGLGAPATPPALGVRWARVDGAKPRGPLPSRPRLKPGAHTPISPWGAAVARSSREPKGDPPVLTRAPRLFAGTPFGVRGVAHQALPTGTPRRVHFQESGSGSGGGVRAQFKRGRNQLPVGAQAVARARDGSTPLTHGSCRPKLACLSTDPSPRARPAAHRPCPDDAMRSFQHALCSLTRRRLRCHAVWWSGQLVTRPAGVPRHQPWRA